MTKFLLAVHVIAAILAVGPVAVAASMFPPAARRALATATAPSTATATAPSTAPAPAPAPAQTGTVGPGDFNDPSGIGGSGSIDGFGGSDATGTLRLLHRICRVYAVVGVVVPVFGFATASRMGVLGSVWLIVSIALTALAALVLAALVLPAQSALVEGDGTAAVTARLAMYTGLFNLLWAAVTVLMIVRPGSTTGA
ncbi:hypothetical protein [Streptomyces sp. SP2-10]|uniref:hypothetical protein n=1 Tax=Streptomyces sp. SP2-10 TaxID=2873385 RepID=UPI001CA6FA7E|nr:hypothetical protein [Streptomyces sp. SP2-10]MBY8846798.1 hypothetical protein [Streptomyces sp. SP2-10]